MANIYIFTLAATPKVIYLGGSSLSDVLSQYTLPPSAKCIGYCPVAEFYLQGYGHPTVLYPVQLPKISKRPAAAAVRVEKTL